jgi:type I restriction enzyme R subunit
MPAKDERMQALSDRQNIVVIADEAHRSQYDLIDGLARNLRDALPKASFIGFTGTPIEKADANTRAVFGDYISIYDIQRAVADGATVPIYYESRIAKLSLNQAELPKLDEEFEQITEKEEEITQEKLKTKWAALEALVGNPKRIGLIARDLVDHYERRLEGLEGKAMVVCMSRRICVDLHDAIIKLRPDWAGAKDDDKEAENKKRCVVKIVMTGGASDLVEWQRHIRNKEKRNGLRNCEVIVPEAAGQLEHHIDQAEPDDHKECAGQVVTCAVLLLNKNVTTKESFNLIVQKNIWILCLEEAPDGMKSSPLQRASEWRCTLPQATSA